MPPSDQDAVVTVNGLALDPRRWEASAHGRPLQLTRTEFSLLMLMARHPERAFSRDELLDAVWGSGYTAGSNVVDQVVAALRRKLADDPRHPTFIETVTGVGYRLRASRGRRLPGGRRPLTAALIVIAVAALIGVAAAAGVLLMGSDASDDSLMTHRLLFHATGYVVDQGDVSGADCSEDLVIANTRSTSDVTGEITGTMNGVSTTRLYQGTDCLSGVSEARATFTDSDGDTLEFTSRAPVITYRLPGYEDTAVNHQVVSIVVTGGTGKYRGARGTGSCDTLSRSTLVGDQLDASSESQCDWLLRIPEGDQASQADATKPEVDVSVSPAELSVFGHETGVPSQARFLVVVRPPEPLRNAMLTLPAPAGVTVQARAVCGAVIRPQCEQDEGGPPPRGQRTWELGEVHSGRLTEFEFTLQLLDATSDSFSVHVEMDADSLPQPLKSREIEIQVVR